MLGQAMLYSKGFSSLRVILFKHTVSPINMVSSRDFGPRVFEDIYRLLEP